MNDKAPDVSYLVYEGSMSRMERMIKRMTYALILTIVLMFATNALWLYEWMQYDYISEDVTLDTSGGTASYIGNDGDIYNGTSESTEDSQETQTE